VTPPKHKVQSQLGRSAVKIFAVNERMNQILIENLGPSLRLLQGWVLLFLSLELSNTASSNRKYSAKQKGRTLVSGLNS
jgi:hypothetical protein